MGTRTDNMKKAILGALAALILCAGFVPAHATPDTSAPTLDLFQLSKSSVDTGTEDRSITLTAELSDPSGIRNASFYCNESVWFSLFPGSSSATIYFDSIGAVRTTASVSETGSSTDIRWVVTFTVPENRPASTCNWRFSAQDLAGNRVNELSYTGQTLQIIEGTVQDQLVPVEPAINLSLSPWGSQVGSDSQAATISGSITSIGEVKLFLLKVCDQTLDLGLGGQVTGNPATWVGAHVRVETSYYSPSTGAYNLTLASTAETSSACEVQALLISAIGETWTAVVGSSTIPAASGSAPATPGVEQYRGHGPDDGEFSAWTKVLANGTQMKFYAKYLQPGQKVQFMVQNSSGVYEQLAWNRVTESDLGSDGAYTNLQNHVYFIRTFDLKPGKNRVRILVDGEIVWGTKTYTLK